MIVQKALRRLLRGRTAIVIAHRLSTIRGADKIVVLNRGEIAETGTHAQLMKLDGLYAHLYHMNFDSLESSDSPNGAKNGKAAGAGRDEARSGSAIAAV